jgi:hypothetical protein
MLEPNFPGAVWIHMLVRTLAGWSSIALRVFDLMILCGICALLAVRLRSREPAGIGGACLALSVCWFYLSLSTWSHCQRDTWMLLPTLAALSLRDLGGVVQGRSHRSVFTIGVFEGALWGCAFWIKPHVAAPVLAVLAASVIWTGRSRLTLCTLAGVLAGGAAVGVAGSGWLMASGAWPYFWETMLEWNPEYMSCKNTLNPWSRYVSLFQSFAPWSWAHVAALPYAIFTLGRAAYYQLLLSGHDDRQQNNRYEALLCALYLGWFAQSVLLQHPFSYVHVPGVILAMAIVAGLKWRNEWRLIPRMMVVLVFVVAFFVSHCTDLSRLAKWKECVLQGPTLAMREAFQARPGPYWSYYPTLIEFLRAQNVRGRDVLVYSSALVPLYRDLDLRPPTRYVLTDVQRGFFRSRREKIRAAIEQSPHRFIVCDISGANLSPAALENNNPATGLPMDFPDAALSRYPATQPVVFRSGCFVVFASRDTAGL